MFTSTKLRTLASALLLACSVAAIGLTGPRPAQNDHVVADSAWGFVAAVEDSAANEVPRLDQAEAPPAARPVDSAW